MVIPSPRRRTRRLPRPQRWLTVVLAVGLLLAAAAQSAAASTRPLVTGISGVRTDPISLQQVKATGAQMVHIWISMRDTSPRSDPGQWQPDDPSDSHYNWAPVDLVVTNAIQGGLTPVLGIYGIPVWAQRCHVPSGPYGAPCDPDPKKIAAFATAAAKRYSGYFAGLPRVRYWQALNEPNLSLFFNPQFESGKPVSPTLYRAVINNFYFAVKSVNPANLVLAAGLGPIARPPWTIGPMRFTRELLCMRGRRNPRPTPGNCEGGVHFDIFDIHPYTTGSPTHEGKIDDVQLGDLAKLTELLAAADRAGRLKGKFRRTPLWITELSWDSKPPDPGGLPMAIHTRWTAEALFRAWNAGVARFFWFSLRDFPANHPVLGVLQSGLYFRGATAAEDQPKKSLYAFRFPFVAYSKPKGFYFWGRTPNSRVGRVLIQIRQGGRWRNTEVVRADRHGIFEGVAKGGYGRRKRGSVRAVYRRERSVPFSLKPVRDFWQPPFGKPVE